MQALEGIMRNAVLNLFEDMLDTSEVQGLVTEVMKGYVSLGDDDEGEELASVWVDIRSAAQTFIDKLRP